MVDIIERQDVNVHHADTPYPLGYVGAIDIRDENYPMELAMRAEPLEALPRYRYYGIHRYGRDMRIGRAPLDQGQCHAENDRSRPDPLGCGHCVGYACKHILLAYPTTNPAPDLSGSDIYHMAQEVDEWDGENYQGTSVRAGFKILQDMGFITEYVWTKNAEDVARWLLVGNGPVAIGSSWYREMFYPEKHNGFIVPQGSSVGGHAWVIDGVNRERRVFRMLNSWGPTWGKRGRAWIRWDDLQRLLSELYGRAGTPTEIVKPR